MGNDSIHINTKSAGKSGWPNQHILWLLLVLASIQLFVAFFTYGSSLHFDEAIWQYLGRNWVRHGLTPYSGGIDNKSPLIFAIYGLSDKLFGVNFWFPRLMGTVFQTIGIYYVYRIAVRLDGEKAGRFSALIYGLSLLWFSTGGRYVAFTETYEITLLIISFYYFLTAQTKRDFFMCGVFVSMAGAFRLSALFLIPVLLPASWRKNRLNALVLCMGILAGISLFGGLAFVTHIKLTDFYNYGIADNFGTGSATDHDFHWRLENFLNKFFFSGLVLFYPLLLAYLFLKKKIDILILWLIGAFAGIHVIGIYDRVHLKEMLPALSLISGICISRLIVDYSLPFKRIWLISWIVFFPKIMEPLISLKKILTGEKQDPDNYCQPPYLKPDDLALKNLGRWIKSNTREDERIYIAGYAAIAQAYSERLSSSVYFNLTQTVNAKKRFIRDISAREPDLLLLPLNPVYTTQINPDLNQFISQLIAKDYYPGECKYGYRIYQKKIHGNADD
jgi:hypothetical protein